MVRIRKVAVCWFDSWPRPWLEMKNGISHMIWTHFWQRKQTHGREWWDLRLLGILGGHLSDQYGYKQKAVNNHRFIAKCT